MPNIREYLDFRAFLRDAYKALHAQDKRFNYQYLIHRLGLKSPGHISSIFKGTRNIPAHLIDSFADLFQLKQADRRYFSNLVRYAQAKSHAQRDRAFKKLTAFHRKKHRIIDPDMYRYFSHWYNPVIRELVDMIDITDDTVEKLARYITPSVPATYIRKSFALLKKMGLIIKKENGCYCSAETILTTGEQWQGVAVHKYQRAAADLAKQALDRIAQEERDISTLTIGCASDRLPVLKKKLQELRAEFLEMAATEKHPDRVFQVNLQLFPLSKKVDRS